MADDDRIADILAEWYDQRERGVALAPEEIVRAHPDLADALTAHFAAQAVFDRMAEPKPVGDAPAVQTIGEFRVLRELGRGGMGVVYEAEQTSMGRRVALKVLYPTITSSRHAAARFVREARAAGRLHHTNIVPVHSMGEESGVWFYAMELVHGRPLDQVIEDLRRLNGAPREKTPSTPTSNGFDTDSGSREHYERIARTFAGVAEGLQTAHDGGVIHRDVKPSNLILDADGTLRITDFGLARVEGEGATITISGDIVGTPAYMSPEQANGSSDGIDARTDVYSLGATLYEVLTRRPPFRGGSPREICAKIASQDPPPPRRFDRRIPRDLETIVERAMEKERERRYASAGEMARDLRLFAEDAAIHARRIGPLGRAWRRVRRHKTLTSLMAAVVVLAGATGALVARTVREAGARRNTEYERLCARAEEALAASATGVRDCSLVVATSSPVGQFLSDAIDLAPERSEAWLGRALAPRIPDTGARLNDLEAARARGLPERSFRLARAWVLRGAGRTDEASHEDALATAAAPSGNALDAYFEGRVLLSAGLRRDAIVKLTTALTDAPEGSLIRTMARYARCRARVLDGQLEGAIDDASTIRGGSSDPGPGLRLELAVLWKRLGRPDRAKAILEDLLVEARHRGSRDAWDDLCSAANKSSFDGFAETVTEEAVGTFSNDERIMLWRVDALRGAGKIQDALAAADRALALPTKSARAFAIKGDILVAASKYGDARDAFNHALAVDHSCAAGHYGLSVLYLKLGKPADRETELRNTIECDRAHHAAHHDLATVLLHDHPVEALASIECAIELDESCRLAHLTRAAALRQLARDPEEILQEFDRVISLDPDDHTAHHQKADLLLSLGRFEEALASYKEAVRIDPTSLGAILGCAEALERLGHIDQGEAEFQRAKSLKPESVDSVLAIGSALFRIRHDAAALVEFERAIGLDSKCTNAHLFRANALRRLDKYQEAVDGYGDVLALDPKHAEALVNRAIALRHLDKRDEAMRDAKLAEDINPKLWQAPNLLAAAFLELGEHEKALREVERAIALDPPSASPWQQEGRALTGLGRNSDALEAYRIAARKEPKSAKAQIDIGNTLWDLGRRDEAIAAFRNAVQADPTFVEACRELGSHLSDLGSLTNERARLLEAREILEHAVELAPKSAAMHRSLGGALSNLGEFGKALDELDEAIHLDSNDLDAHRFRARTFHRMKNIPPMIAEAEFVVAMSQESSEDHLYLAIALGEGAQFEKAVSEFNKARALAPQSREPFIHEAAMWKDADRFEEAFDAWRRLLEVDGEFAQAYDERGQLLAGHGRFDEALKEFDQAIRRESGVAAYHLHRGTLLLENLHQWSDALLSLQKAVDLHDASAQAHHEYGFALWYAGRLDDASRQMERAIQLNAHDVDSRVDRWSILTVEERHAEALRNLESNHKELPDIPCFVCFEVISLRLLGRAEEARSLAADSLAKEPASDDVLDYAYLCAIAGRPQDAKSWLARGDTLKDGGDDVDRARVYAALRDRENALHWIEAAAEHGYRRPARRPAEPDFDFLKNDPRYQVAISKIFVP